MTISVVSEQSREGEESGATVCFLGSILIYLWICDKLFPRIPAFVVIWKRELFEMHKMEGRWNAKQKVDGS